MVKPGYKQTEIGVLPESWDTISFEDCFAILPNNTLSRAELNYNGGEVRNIHYGDILVKFPAVLDCSAEGLPYINKGNVAKASIGFLRDGDLIMADTAEDVIVGKSTEVIGIGDSKIVSGLHTIPCRPRDAEMFAPKWLGYFINHCTYHDQLIPYITGIKVSSVSKSAISSTVIAVPPKPVQAAIAEALSDIDTLIVNLEKLIAKKKAIKQGAMQELLTGKRRLPGFDGEWKSFSISEIGKVITGATPSRQIAGYWNGDFPWVSAQDFSGKYVSDTIEKVTSEGMKNCRILPSGAVLVTCIASIGLNAIATVSCATNQQINALVCNDGFFNEFVYYAICHSKQRMTKIAGQTAVPIMNKTQFEEFQLFVPQDLDEQREIASILADMDTEISKYERQYQKVIHIKSGMMSELLTGHIRLV